MLSLNLRPARLNQDHRGKSKEVNGEVTKLLTFGIDAMLLDESELGALTGVAHAFRSLFDTSGAQPEPVLPCFKPQQFLEDIEGAAVTVRLKGGAEYRFTNCVLSKLRVHVVTGGPQLSCKVLTAPALDATLAPLVANFGELVDVELHGSTPSDQKELPLNSHGTGAQSDAAKPKRRGSSHQAAH